MVRRAVVVLALAALTFGAVTVVALEGREVVVLETHDASGAARRTRTWIADDGDSLLVEAATPERPFVQDLAHDPTLVLERAGERRECTAEVVPNPGGHVRIRRLLAERYGWADRWVALVADTTRSIALRLTCA